MQAIKLVARVAPNLLEPTLSYGDVDVSVSMFPMQSTQDRHILPVQDRIHAITNGLGLQKDHVGVRF